MIEGRTGTVRVEASSGLEIEVPAPWLPDAACCVQVDVEGSVDFWDGDVDDVRIEGVWARTAEGVPANGASVPIDDAARERLEKILVEAARAVPEDGPDSDLLWEKMRGTY